MRAKTGARRVIKIVAAVAVNGAGEKLLVRKRGTAPFMQPGGKLADGGWHHPDESPAFALAPLTRDHVLPLVRAWRPR